MAHHPLKPFGNEGTSHSMGYTLPMLTGWIESLANDEEDRVDGRSPDGRIYKRYEKVMEALQLLNEACDEEYDPS